jgi:transcriptional regulator with XRE-family HTH domain
MKRNIQQSVFSKNLIRLRKEKGLSQSELAKLTGLTQRIIGYYETTASQSLIDNLTIIAKALDISVYDLIESKEKSGIQNEFKEFDTRTINKFRLILSLPKNDRHMLYSIAEALHLKNQQQGAGTNECNLVEKRGE